MNYFGLFFTFMVPGILMGAMAAYVVYDNRRRKAVRRRAAQRAIGRRLYVCDLNRDRELAA